MPEQTRSVTFKEFFKAYPPRFHPRQGKNGRYVRDDPHGARKEWNKLTDEEKDLAYSRATELERGPGTQFILHARKWLKDKRWKDEVVEEPQAEIEKPATVSDRQIRENIGVTDGYQL